MPFTLSHPLAVVPFARSRLVFSALVIGSMSPDFEYFLRLRQNSHASHTLSGIFTHCLPAGLLALWLWHRLLKRPLLELVPDAHRIRLQIFDTGFRFGPGRRFLCLCASLVIGAATHILWDSFTHGWGAPVASVGFLQTALAVPGFPALPLYRYLQHASTLLGLLALAFLYAGWFRRAKPSSTTAGLIPARVRICVVLVGAAGALALGVAAAAHRFPVSDPANIRGFVVRTAVVSMSAFSLLAGGFGLWFHRRFPRA